MPKLLVPLSDAGDVVHDLMGAVITIGRAGDNAIQIFDDSVADHHAALHRQNGGYRLRDRDGRSFINGVAVTEAQLENSCVVRFGNVECFYKGEPQQDHQQRVAQLEQRLAELDGERADYEKQIQRLTGETAEAEKSRADLALELAEVRRRCEILQASEQTLIAARDELAEKMAAQQTQNQQLTEEDLLGRLESVAAERDFLLNERHELLGKTEKQDSELELLSKRCQSAENEAQKNAQRFNESQRELTLLAGRLESAEAANSAYAERWAQAEQRVQELSEQINQSTQQPVDAPPQAEEAPAAVFTEECVANDGAEAEVTAVAPEEEAPNEQELEAKSWFRRALEVARIARPAAPEPEPVVVEVAQEQPEIAAEPDESGFEQLTIVARSIPKTLTTMRNCVQYYTQHRKELKIFHQLLTHAQALAARTIVLDAHPLNRLAAGVESLVTELRKFPEQITLSNLRTIGQAIDCMGLVSEKKNLARCSALPAPHVFSVDDDTEIQREIVGTLMMARLTISCANDPRKALAVLAQHQCDLLLFDVHMPELNGMELCVKVRQLPHHKLTPIVFLTAAATAENQAQSTLIGANDFIGKPFNLAELALKALVWSYRNQLGAL